MPLLIDVKPKPVDEDDILRWQDIVNANYPLSIDRPFAICACPGGVWYSPTTAYNVSVAEAGILLTSAHSDPWQGEWWKGDDA